MSCGSAPCIYRHDVSILSIIATRMGISHVNGSMEFLAIKAHAGMTRPYGQIVVLRLLATGRSHAALCRKARIQRVI